MAPAVPRGLPILALLLWGCGGPSPVEMPSPPPAPVAVVPEGGSTEGVEGLVRLARTLQADPTAADTVLAAEGMDLEAWTDRMVEVAVDGAASAAFVAGVEAPAPTP